MYIYQRGERINSRITAKEKITKLLEGVTGDEDIRSKFEQSIKSVEAFIYKVRIVLNDQNTDQDDTFLRNELNRVFQLSPVRGTRSYNMFYILWYVLSRIDVDVVKEHPVEIKRTISDLMSFIKHITVDETQNPGDGMALFNSKVDDIWKNIPYILLWSGCLQALGQVMYI